ncbi:PKD domain-containing protein [Chloroflexota bacterium]
MVRIKTISIFISLLLVTGLLITAAWPVFAQQGDEIQVTDTESYADQPAVAIDSDGNVHIAYSDDYGTDVYEIFYTMLNSNGDTLIAPTLITPDDDYKSKRPSIVVDSDDYVHIVWQAYDEDVSELEVFYTKLDPGEDDQSGDTADESEITIVDDMLISEDDGDYAQNPRMAIDSDDNLHVVWNEYTLEEIFYTKLDNDGDTLIDDIQLTAGQEQWRANAGVAIDSDDNVHIAWCGYDDESTYEIFYMMLDGDNGDVLIDDTRLTEDDGYDSRRPSIAVDSDDNVFIVWHDWRSDDAPEIYYTKVDPSQDDQSSNAADESEITVIDDTRLSDEDDTYSKLPMITTSCGGNYIGINWYEDYEGEDGHGSIHFMVIDTDGDIEVDETRLVEDTATKDTYWTLANMASDNAGSFHIVWCDDRTGYYEVWYTTYERPRCGEEEVTTLVASFIGEPLIGEAPHTVQFRDRSTGDIDEWWWSFGDGGTSDSRSPAHTYENEGQYMVTLTVRDGRLDDTMTRSGYVMVESGATPAQLVVRDLYINPLQAQPRQAIGITANIYNEGGGWGSATVNLLVNGALEQSIGVGVAPGTAQPVNFTVYRVEAAEYQVEILDAVGTFFVMEEEEPETPSGYGPIDTGGMIAIVLIGIILIGGVVVVFLFTRR